MDGSPFVFFDPAPVRLQQKRRCCHGSALRRRPVPGCGSQRMLHALERRSHPADHGPSFASLFPPLAAVSSAAIPVWVKLKIPRANAAAATTLDIPTGWDLQQRRPRPVADAGRSCWGSGQQDASAAQGTRGCWEPQLGALKRAHWALFCRLRAAVFLRFLVRVKTAATTVDIPGRWDPRANQSPTGALVAVLRTAALFDSSYGLHKKIPDPKIRDFL